MDRRIKDVLLYDVNLSGAVYTREKVCGVWLRDV